jgi:hypothetical protein
MEPKIITFNEPVRKKNGINELKIKAIRKKRNQIFRSSESLVDHFKSELANLGFKVQQDKGKEIRISF